MPTVILRGSKDGQRIARLVLEGSSSNPIRQGILNSDPFEVTDEEFAKLDQRYVLEPADDKPEDTDVEMSPEPEQGGDSDTNQDET
jgi:hypothetical protein